MRDLKRFLNLIKSITWICQRNRIQYEYKNYKIVVSSAEDLYNGMEIGEEIFAQSYSGMDKRLLKVIKAYSELIKTRPGEIKNLNTDDPTIEELCWIDRSVLQKELDIKKVDTIKNHINTLVSKNIFTTCHKGNRVYVASKFDIKPTNLPTNKLLITYPKNDLYHDISSHESDILKELMVGKRGVIGRSSPIYKTNLLSLQDNLPTDNEKNRHPKHELKSISALKHEIGRLKLVGQQNDDQKGNQKTLIQYEKNKEKDTNKKQQNNFDLDKKNIGQLNDRIIELKEFIYKVQSKDYKVTYPALIHAFDQPFIENAKKNNLIGVLPNGSYEWRGK